jgi:hypothetical protein
MSDHVLGWKIDRGERDVLLAAMPAAYSDPVADHVTLKSRVDGGASPPADTIGEIVGVADDGEGVQAMVVAIGGTTDRPGGGSYHITWSLDRAKGREAKESNEVIGAQGWTPLKTPRPVTLTGSRWPR